MEIDSRYVGMRSKPLTISLSPRQAMNYAAALGDANPHYMDDTRDGGIVAPPMLAVALTWPLSSRFDLYWQDTGLPEEALQRQVHYNESLVWKRPIQPDESLAICGEIVSMSPHASGTLITMRYDASASDKTLVFTEYISGLLRDVILSDGGRKTDRPPAIAAAPEAEVDCWETEIAIDPLAAHVYDGCTDIVFPIHTSAAFAGLVGLPGPIYQGTATLGLAVREILNREGGGNPAALKEVHCGFRGMVFPGTAITVRVSGRERRGREQILYFDVVNESGGHALKYGRLHLTAPA